MEHLKVVIGREDNVRDESFNVKFQQKTGKQRKEGGRESILDLTVTPSGRNLSRLACGMMKQSLPCA